MRQGVFVISVALALSLSGCAVSVHPSAETVAKRLSTKSEDTETVARWLVSRGYHALERTKYGGVWPKTGPCFEKTRGGPLTGVEIARVCFARNEHPIILSRNTHGHGWTEVYPINLMNAPYPEKGVYRLSKKTQRTLEQ